MKSLMVYECEHCKKLFRTPSKHHCKFNPELKNCFTCGNLKGWLKNEENTPVYIESGIYSKAYPNYPDCAAGVDGWDIEDIKRENYNMQCGDWKGRESK